MHTNASIYLSTWKTRLIKVLQSKIFPYSKEIKQLGSNRKTTPKSIHIYQKNLTPGQLQEMDREVRGSRCCIIRLSFVVPGWSIRVPGWT